MSVETQAAELAFRGYRRVSNKYGIVARIDRSDWREVLNKQLRRDTLEVPGVCWEDHYRRTYSRDTLPLIKEAYRLIPSSCHDYTGFIDDIPF
jgi:hypothetical protein